MKEKMKELLKQRLFLVMVVSLALVIIFGFLAVSAVPRQSRVVKRFCKALERFDEEGMEKLINKDTELEIAIYSDTPADLLALVNPETDTIKCSISQPTAYGTEKGVKMNRVVMEIFEANQLKTVYDLEVVTERVGLKNRISYVWKTIKVDGLLSGRPNGLHGVDVDVDTWILGQDYFRRSTRIQYNTGTTEDEIWDRVEKILGEEIGDYEKEYKVRLECKTEGDSSCLYIVQRGTTKDIQKSSEVLFGGDGTICTHDGGRFKLRNDVGYYQWMDLSNFTTLLSGECFTYTFTFMPGTGLYVKEGEQYELIGNKLCVENVKNNTPFVIAGTQWNLWAIGFWSMVLVTVISGGLWLKKYGYINKAFDITKKV